MTISLNIPSDNNEDGLKIHWEHGFTIEVNSLNEITFIRANKEGLMSLAIQLLTLAQDNVTPGTHIHYDAFSCLEEGSTELIIDKIV